MAVTTTLDLPGVFRIEEASNKAARKLNQSHNKLTVRVTLADEGIIYQPGDKLTITNSDRGVSALEVWVESVVMVDYGRYSVVASTYDTNHFTDYYVTEQPWDGSPAPTEPPYFEETPEIIDIPYVCDAFEDDFAAAISAGTEGGYWATYHTGDDEWLYSSIFAVDPSPTDRDDKPQTYSLSFATASMYTDWSTSEPFSRTTSNPREWNGERWRYLPCDGAIVQTMNMDGISDGCHLAFPNRNTLPSYHPVSTPVTTASLITSRNGGAEATCFLHSYGPQAIQATINGTGSGTPFGSEASIQVISNGDSPQTHTIRVTVGETLTDGGVSPEVTIISPTVVDFDVGEKLKTQWCSILSTYTTDLATYVKYTSGSNDWVHVQHSVHVNIMFQDGTNFVQTITGRTGSSCDASVNGVKFVAWQSELAGGGFVYRGPRMFSTNNTGHAITLAGFGIANEAFSDATVASLQRSFLSNVYQLNCNSIAISAVNQTSGGTVSWTPDLTETDFWVDASDTSTITATGGRVDSMTDKSGNGVTLSGVDESPISKPITGSTTQNGLNVLDFDGGQYLQSSNARSYWNHWHNGTEGYAFVVYKTEGANPDNVQTIFGTGGASSTQAGFRILYDDRSSVPREDKIFHYASSGSSSNIQALSSDDFVTPDAFNLISIRSDPTAGTIAGKSQLRWAGNTAEATNVDGDSAGSTDTEGDMRLGIDNLDANPLTGSIAEIVMMKNDLSTTDREFMEGYLAHKWGLEADLPVGHTHKSASPTTALTTFTVVVTGSAPYSYQWQQDTAGDNNFSDMQGETTNNISVPSSSTNQYQCIVSNACSTATSTPTTVT